MKNLIVLVLVIFNFESSAERLAIIGGGMAGVATAAFLMNSHHEIHLFEKESRLGGNAKTIPLRGKDNQLVNVDIGPQYFADSGWELYIDFLKYFKLYNKKNIYNFNADFTLFRPNQSLPDVTLPDISLPGLEWLFSKPDALSRLLSLLGFFQEITKFHNRPDKENITMAEFLNTLSIENEFKENIILPVLAASFTLPLEKMPHAGAIFVGGLMHAEGIIPSSTFQVPKKGMQFYIEEIARKISKKSKNLNIHLNKKVENISKNSDGSLKVTYNGGEEMNFDKVILAVHPYIAAELLKDWEIFSGIWDKFTYVDTTVVIHDETDLLHPNYRSFYNVNLKDNGEYYMAMNLGKIAPEFGNLIKSWGLNKDEYLSLKEKGKIKAEAHFKHPFPTVDFIESNNELRRLAKEEGNIFFAGGWIMNWETQHTAILSGYEVAREIEPKIIPFWKKKLPFLKNSK